MSGGVGEWRSWEVTNAEFREVLEDRRRNMRWRCSNICVSYRV